MSVQNNLKKPAFTKTVMGYNVSEVDKYIEHITERYNSVCAENSELKRRVLRLQLKLDETSDKLGDAETAVVDPKPLNRSVLYEVFDVLDAELRRTEAFYEDLKSKLNAISEVKNDESDDSAWEGPLSAFISSIVTEENEDDAEDTEDSEEIPYHDGENVPADDKSTADKAPSQSIFADFESFVMCEDDELEAPATANDAEIYDEPSDDLSADDEFPANDEADEETVIMNSDADDDEDRSDASYEEETEMLLKLLQGTFNVASEEERSFEHDLGAEFAGGEYTEDAELDDDPLVSAGIGSEAAEEHEPDVDSGDASEDASEDEAREKTPAEIAAELDFYTDSVHRDGESFDPMMLARLATDRKPKYEDFFNTDHNKN